VFYFGELAIGPELATSVAFGWLRSVGSNPVVPGVLEGGGKGRLPIPTGGSAFSLGVPSNGVAPQGVSLSC